MAKVLLLLLPQAATLAWWRVYLGGGAAYFGSTFDVGYKYQARITIALKSGYEWDESVSCQINGKTPLTWYHNTGNNTYEAILEYDPLPATMVTAVDVRLTQYPAAGKDVSDAHLINTCSPAGAVSVVGIAVTTIFGKKRFFEK